MIEVSIDSEGKRYVRIAYVYQSVAPDVDVIARKVKAELAEHGIEVDYVVVMTFLRDETVDVPNYEKSLECFKQTYDKDVYYELPDDRQFIREQKRDAKRNYQMQQERKYRSAYRHAYTHVWRNHAANSNKYKPIKIRKR